MDRMAVMLKAQNIGHKKTCRRRQFPNGVRPKELDRGRAGSNDQNKWVHAALNQGNHSTDGEAPINVSVVQISMNKSTKKWVDYCSRVMS